MSTISRRSFVTGGASLAAGLAASVGVLTRAGSALAGSALAGSDGETVYSNARILLGTMPSEGATELRGGLRIVNGLGWVWVVVVTMGWISKCPTYGAHLFQNV